MASLCIDSGQRGFAFTLQNQKEICVKFLHENAFVAILLPVTKRKHCLMCQDRIVADSYSLWSTYFAACSISAWHVPMLLKWLSLTTEEPSSTPMPRPRPLPLVPSRYHVPFHDSGN